jgi:LEA14-like dessication related protein
MRWLWRLLFIAILLAAAVLGFLALTYEEPQVVGVSSVEISAPEDSVVSIVVSPLIYNPNLFGIPVESIDGEIEVGGEQVGGFSADSAFTLTADDTTALLFRIELSVGALSRHYNKWMAVDSSLVVVKGDAQVNLWLSVQSVPLAFSDMIPLKAILTEQINTRLEEAQRITSVELITIARDSSSLNAVLAMTNPYPFPITLQRTDCIVAVGSAQVGTLELTGPIRIEAHGTKTIRQRVDLSNTRSLMGLGAMVLGSQVTVVGATTIEMLGYEFVIPIDQKPGLSG